MKLIVAGGRDFSNRTLLYAVLDDFRRKFRIDTILSGFAKGADTLGAEYASERSIPVKSYPADWDKNGNAAGYIRNAEMGKDADAAICFWDGKSKGTKHMIHTMKRQNKPCYVFDYEGNRL